MRKLLPILALFLFFQNSISQTKIAVVDFQTLEDDFSILNITSQFPNLLQTELSDFAEFTLVERRDLDKVLQEQEFIGSELTEDSEAISLGNLYGADFVINGQIFKESENEIRIDVKILHVQTGKTLGEKVSGKRKYLSRMAELLAKNIHASISGSKDRVKELQVASQSNKGMIFMTLASTAFAGISFWQSKIAAKNYKEETQLSKIEGKYKTAKRWQKASIYGSVSAVIFGYFTLKRLFSDENSEYIYTQKPHEFPFQFSYQKDEVKFGLEVNF
ncbi:MAG: hypothetical protein DWQ06_03985 [Calditrichaeota bacterium]|nr:MAG: hypothetical protein DWQ06_03985 [Calditrichota bacterium]